MFCRAALNSTRRGLGKTWRCLVPRYFFTIRGRDRFKADSHGANLPDIAAALSNAERKIRELRKWLQQRYDSDDDSKG